VFAIKTQAPHTRIKTPRVRWVFGVVRAEVGRRQPHAEWRHQLFLFERHGLTCWDVTRRATLRGAARSSLIGLMVVLGELRIYLH
jgi:hypothetical protein